MTDDDPPKVGDRLVCIHAGTTLLVNGATYHVADVAHLPPAITVELAELRGFLFGLYRFERATT